MKITKYVHSCLLVETDTRTAIFDPGSMSVDALNVDELSVVDDIIITHGHADHFDVGLIKQLVAKFPNALITAPTEVTEALAKEGITASDQPSPGIAFFDAPHEDVTAMFGANPDQIGVHYLDVFSDPGDSHSFNETKAILALPITAPWGSSNTAVALALKLKPQHVIPIHDWHWNDQAQNQMYQNFEQTFAKQGITFHKPVTGEPITIDI